MGYDMWELLGVCGGGCKGVFIMGRKESTRCAYSGMRDVMFLMEYCHCLCLKVMGKCLRIEGSEPRFGAMSSNLRTSK